MITKNNFFNKNSCLQLFCRSNRSLKRQKSETNFYEKRTTISQIDSHDVTPFIYLSPFSVANGCVDAKW